VRGRKMIVFSSDEVKDWLDTFDGNSAEDLIASIVNNEIKHEVLVDSICAFANGRTKLAGYCYEEMWKKGEK
jgi:hypothetical protein